MPFQYFHNRYKTAEAKANSKQDLARHLYFKSFAAFFFDRLRIKSFSCFDVLIIIEPPDIVSILFQPETGMHTALMFANSYLCVGHIALLRLERFGFQPLCDCGSDHRWFFPYHRPEPYVQRTSEQWCSLLHEARA